jgi:RNA polymerase sigma-70 factor, ECF subfamily
VLRAVILGGERRQNFVSTLALTAVGSSVVAEDAARAAAAGELESLRRPLTGYCYRMLGSAFDAEDAVQETLLRAWQRAPQLRDPSAEQAWVYRIATRVCLDMLRAGKRRALPLGLGPPASRPEHPGEPAAENSWVWPVPDELVIGADGDPAEIAAQRESIRLAFVAALQLLPPRQRAVLVLRDVLSWSAAEVAGLLDMTTVAVNSALLRGRETLAAFAPTEVASVGEQSALLDRYVDAFERFDLDGLTSLLHLDATLSMPPYSRWLRGREEIRAWYAGPGNGCRGSRLCRLTANGSPAVGQYRPGGKPCALHVLQVDGGRITAINSFLDTQRLFPLFGLPLEPAS